MFILHAPTKISQKLAGFKCGCALRALHANKWIRAATRRGRIIDCPKVFPRAISTGKSRRVNMTIGANVKRVPCPLAKFYPFAYFAPNYLRRTRSSKTRQGSTEANNEASKKQLSMTFTPHAVVKINLCISVLPFLTLKQTDERTRRVRSFIFSLRVPPLFFSI